MTAAVFLEFLGRLMVNASASIFLIVDYNNFRPSTDGTATPSDLFDCVMAP